MFEINVMYHYLNVVFFYDFWDRFSENRIKCMRSDRDVTIHYHPQIRASLKKAHPYRTDSVLY